MEEFNQFMENTNNLDRPGSATGLGSVLVKLTNIQLLFALNYIYQTVDLSNRSILKRLLCIHQQRLDNEINFSL